jgi:hypothetical protein
VVYHIQKILEEGDLPSDIFILGASVKGANSNVRRMENALVEKGIPCHVPMMEEGGIDERVINGKVVFSTYHQSKGRQRKYVFLVGFDHSYFAYYAKNLPEDHCPNTLYVGCTRATHRMFLLENNDRPTDQPLRFLKMNHYEMKDQEYIDFKGHPQVLFYEKDPQLAAEEAASAARKRPVHFVTPTDLIKFIPESVLEEITPLVERIFKPVTVTGLPELTAEDIPTIVAFPSSGLYEDVADLNGIALPCMFWDRLNHDNINVLYSLIEGMLADTGDNEHLFLKRRFREVDPTNHTPANYLYLANLYLAVQEKLYFKLCQIAKEEYNWLSETVVDRCRRRLDLVVGCETIIDHEYTFIHPKMEMEHRPIDELLDHHLVGGQGTAVTPLSTPKYRFSARLDLVTQSSIWEIKCTHQITIDHMLQVVIYAWLWRLVPGYDAKKNAKIFNLKTGEVFVLDATTEELTKIVVELLRGKYEKHEPLSDDDFLTLCRTTVSS